jgi:PAS domain S-box-containing protein
MSKAVILIVEDETIVAADLEIKLKQLGYEVAGIASQGREAVEMAMRRKPQLVLMDIQLEGSMDGIETAREINSRHDVPIVYLTAHSDPATLSRAKLSGPFGYILKPFDERELVTQIELAFYKHQTDKQLHDQRELLRITLSSIGDGVIATNAQGDISFINSVAESLTGWSADGAIGKPLDKVLRVIDEHTAEALENPMENLVNTGKISSPASRWLLHGRAGAKIPIWSSGAPIRDNKDHFRGLVLVFRDISLQRQAEKEKDSLIAELKKAMGKVKMLSGLLPICASCKKIRDDKGYWNQIEAYIRTHSEAEFSHGICPECAQKLYSNLLDPPEK